MKCKWRAGSLTLFPRGVCRGFLGTAPGKGWWIMSRSILSLPQQHRDGFFSLFPNKRSAPTLPHLNKTAAAPLANPDITGCFAVSRITYCSVTWCLLPLHPFEVHFAVKRWLCVMQKKVLFPSVYLPNKD